MKKNLIVAAAMVAGVLSASAFADDGKINFTGSITDDACTVVNTVSSPLSVKLGTVSSTAFTTGSMSAAATKFTIALTGCPASMTSAAVKFDGTANSNDTTILALTAEAGVATNVGIQLKDNKNTIIPLRTASSSYPLTVGANNLEFTAQYLATALPVTAGPANGTSNFTIVYN